MLSQQAFNALLKTLEEPPSHVKFVFATTESHKVLPTIVSRCQRFEFRSIPAALIVKKLNEICVAESIEVETEAIEAVARMAMGGMRDAQSILDQMISFCGKTISQNDVLEVYGLASRERISHLAQYINDANYDSIIEYTDLFSIEGIDFYRALLDLSDTFRELLLKVLRNEESAINCSPEQCVRILDALRQGEDLVRMGLSEKTNFEVTLFRAVEAGRNRSIDQVIRKISGMVPADVKKKVELNSSINPPVEIVQNKVEESIVSKEFASVELNEDLVVEEPASAELGNEIEPISTHEQEPSTEIDEILENSEDPRQVLDRKKIESKIAELPKGIRGVLEEKFQADFVSIEKIDMKKLI
jgi:DNA polymerase-3 subunit gamma/tau